MSVVTKAERRELFPRVRNELRGDERIVLDLRCGPGRFTAGLADLIEGRAIGVDPVPRYPKMAPQDSGERISILLGRKLGTSAVAPVNDVDRMMITTEASRLSS